MVMLGIGEAQGKKEEDQEVMIYLNKETQSQDLK
jgi:hypothetical protein